MTKFTLNQQSGLIEQAHLCLSPNCDQRPMPEDISLLVIHNISLPPGEFGGKNIEAFFCNRLEYDKHPFFNEIKDLCVSAHLLIDRNGDVTQFVPLHLRAWHAGKSCYQGRERCNDFSIGIELEGTDLIPYSDAQYLTLSELARLITEHYPSITPERITGHQDIAPGRKTDPGPAFDWHRFRQLCEAR